MHSGLIKRSGYAFLAPVFLALWLAACGSAPVGDGFYRVQRGDTLSKIAKKYGRSVGQLASWNRLTNPNAIDVGQVLRIAPASGASSGTAIATGGAVAAAPERNSRRSDAPPVAAHPRNEAPPPSAAIALGWPTTGPIIANYNAATKGIDIGGSAGQTIVSAADGKVVYVGQLRGYGNLVIIKHGAFLTSYGHLQRVNTSENANVRAGQPIGTMGDTDATQVKLHFELRYNGAPLDPLLYLPKR